MIDKLILISCCCLFFIALPFHSKHAHASEVERVASINICTDLLLYHLAPEKITSLSFLVLDDNYSRVAKQVAEQGIPINRAKASELLLQQPNLILASIYTPAQKIHFLRSLGLRVWQLGSPITLQDTYDEIMAIAKVLDKASEGEVLVAQMKAKYAELQLRQSSKAENHPANLISLSPNKHVTGAGNLSHEVIEKSGFTNLGAQITPNFWSKKSLESLILLKPDAWLIGRRYHDNDIRNNTPNFDKANEYLSHRALRAVIAKSNLLHLENNLTSCFGPQTMLAIEMLMNKFDAMPH